jgi:hypothetical protein
VDVATDVYQPPPNNLALGESALTEEALRQKHQAEAARHPFKRDPSTRWWRRLAAKLRHR